MTAPAGQFSEMSWTSTKKGNALIIIITWVWPPHRMPVTTRIITFLVGDPNLNLHLPLLLCEGAISKSSPCPRSSPASPSSPSSPPAAAAAASSYFLNPAKGETHYNSFSAAFLFEDGWGAPAWQFNISATCLQSPSDPMTLATHQRLANFEGAYYQKSNFEGLLAMSRCPGSD